MATLWFALSGLAFFASGAFAIVSYLTDVEIMTFGDLNQSDVDETSSQCARMATVMIAIAFICGYQCLP